jgi:hypothetical protein
VSRKTEATLQNLDVEVPPHAWTTLNQADRQAIRDQLSRVLSSPPFSTSKRYPALLNHVVEYALKGQTDGLKERTIGVEVFHRDPQYDTSTDPVVRIAAGEVRKRLAQYYYDPANAREIRIELPSGSYIPEFYPASEESLTPISTPFIPADHIPTGTKDESSPLFHELHHTRSNSRSYRIATPLICLLAGLLIGAASMRLHRSVSSAPTTAMDEFWGPLISSPGDVRLCIGQVYVTQVWLDPNGARNRFDSPIAFTPPTKRAALSNLADSTTLARVAGLLERRGKTYSIHGQADTTFSDLASGPSVLIGAFDNDWTIRLSDQLRFHFEMDSKTKEEWIVDGQKPDEKMGPHIYGSPAPNTADAYAIVSRVRDPSTGQMVVSLAGLTGDGTRAASIFVSEPGYLDDLAKHAPPDWKHKNLQIVIAAGIVDGSLGRPRVVSSFVW